MFSALSSYRSPPSPERSGGCGQTQRPRSRFWARGLLGLIATLIAVALTGGTVYGEIGVIRQEHGSYRPVGTIVAPHGAGLQLTDVQTGSVQDIAVTPSVGIAGHAVWSPDHQRLAMSRFGRRPGERVGGSDILLVSAAGGEARTVAEHDIDGALLGAPAWLPDGSGLFYDRLPPSGGPTSSSVMFVSLDPRASARTIGVGGWPAVSPDGRFLAYVRPSGISGDLNELVMTDLSGGERILVPADELVQIISPRFSPDGTKMAFIGSDSRGEAASESPGLTGLFLKGVLKGVRAHGPPGDIWVMELDGGKASRLTSAAEDEPTLAWSPDGYWLAMMGGGGLYLVPRDLSSPPRLLAKGGFGGIDWR